MVYQSFVHNLNSWINQVSASVNLLVPMPPPPPVPPLITPFVIIDASTSGQSFGCQGTRHQRSDNSVSSVSINRRPYNRPIYDDKLKFLTWTLGQMMLILFVAVVWNSKKQCSWPTRMLDSLRLVIYSTNHHKKSKYFWHTSLSEEEIKSGWKLGLDSWADTGWSGKHDYVDDFLGQECQYNWINMHFGIYW